MNLASFRNSEGCGDELPLVHAHSGSDHQRQAGRNRLRGWRFFARGAWKTAQVGNRPMERTHQVSRHQTRLIFSAQMPMHWTLPWPPHGICARGRVGAYTIIKTLLLLAFIAVACEAMAQDAQCDWRILP